VACTAAATIQIVDFDVIHAGTKRANRRGKGRCERSGSWHRCYSWNDRSNRPTIGILKASLIRVF
jgi:hypothetical protein